MHGLLQFARKRPHQYISLLIGFLGASALLSSYFRAFHATSNLVHIAHVSTFTLGFLLLYLSWQLHKRKQAAWWASIAVLLLLTEFNAIHGHHMWRIIFYFIALGLLVKYRSVFTVKSDNVSLVRGLRIAVLMLGIAILYGIAGFYVLDSQAFGRNFTLSQSTVYTILQIMSFQNYVTPMTPRGRFFLDSLDLVSIAAFILAVSALFKPVRFILSGGRIDRDAAERIIATRSTSVEDFFKLWPEDKHYFFNAARTSVVAYKVSQGAALVLDGPSGDPKTFKALLKDFVAFARANDWSPAIIHSDQAVTELAQSIGMKSIFIGNEAVIDVDLFCDSTYRNKHFRYVSNKAEREGLSFAVWNPPLTDMQIAQLKDVSDSWLQVSGRREYTFSMGYFDEEYLRQCHVAILEREGAVIAYVNIIPSYVPSARSIDHMRHVTDLPSVGMHYLLKELLLHLQTEGVKSFNLGLTPLSGVEERHDIPNRVLSLVKRLGSRVYSFAGLEQFKNKFQPAWEPRYIAYFGGPAGLLEISSGLSRAMSLPISNRRTRGLVLAAVLIAALSYLSFVFARFLGVPEIGLVSELGARGKQYAWLFNGCDILSGLLMVGVAFWSLQSTTLLGRPFKRLMMGFYGIAGLGAALAALAPLPAAYNLSVVQGQGIATLAHAFFSALNIGGMYIAIALYVLTSKKYKAVWIFLGLSTVVLGALSLTWALSPVGGILQRMQLICVSLWILLIGLRAVPRPVTVPPSGNMRQ